MAAHTYRFTAITNLVILRRDVQTAHNFAVAVNEDIPNDQEVEIFPVTGTTGGTATLVRRTAGVNSSAVTVKKTTPRRVSVSALFSQFQNADKLANPYVTPTPV